MPNSAKYSRSDGMKCPCIRSSWMRSIITTSAPFDRFVDRRRRVHAEAARCPAASASPARTPRRPRPSSCSSSMFERSTRLCSRSPTIATFSPASRPLCSRIVKASSSACVGCSCMPSPALMIADAADPRQQVRRAGRGVAHHDHVGRHRLEVARGVEQRLALGDARRRGRDVQRVGAEPLLGDLERGPGARARLEEQVDDRPAAQRRDLLDRPRCRLPSSPRRCRGSARSPPASSSSMPEQVPRAQPDGGGLDGRRGVRGAIGGVRAHASPSMRTSSAPSISWSRTCTLCSREVGTFLPT